MINLGGVFLYIAFGVCGGGIGMWEAYKDRDLFDFCGALLMFLLANFIMLRCWEVL